MNEFIKTLLSLSVSGTLLLLLILGLKQLYKNKFSRCWQYYIWFIVVLRFLLPFTPDTTIVGSLFERFDTTEITNEIPAAPTIPASVHTENGETAPVETIGNTTVSSVHKPLDLYVCLFFIWAVPALVLFIRKITIYRSFIRHIKAGNTEVSDVKILNLLSECKEKRNVKIRVELFCNPLIASPMLVGFFHPEIILPAGKLGEKELSYIFTHELIHYKRRDMFYKWLIQLVVCIHWFNPFVYLLEKEVNKACELSCDEKVISALDNTARREYGDMLISFLKTENHYRNSFASVTLTEGAEQIKERLGAIMKFKKSSKTVLVITAIFTAAVCFCFLATGAYAAPSVNKNDKVWKDDEIVNDVLKKDGVYYIFCDGAGENDKPQSSVSDGSIKFVLVRKDSYTSIGPFNHLNTLIKEVSQQCSFMLENGMITEEEKNLVLNTAKMIEKKNSYTYTQRGYYSGSYIIEMGWNLPAENQEYGDAAEIVLEDNSKMAVYFSDTAKDYINDSEAVTAIKELIYSLKNQDISPAIETPFIVSITPAAAEDIPALAEEYFQKEDPVRFSALFPKLKKTAQMDYCQKIYDTDKIALFSAVIWSLDEDSILLYVDKSEQDNKINFFAVLSDYMQPDDVKRYAEKYYETDNIARFTILLD